MAGRRLLPHVTKVHVVRDFVVRVEFDDGFVREIDLEPQLRGPVFAPLRDPALFRQVTVDPVSRTIAWPNGADLAPEFLRWGPDPANH